MLSVGVSFATLHISSYKTCFVLQGEATDSGESKWIAVILQLPWTPSKAHFDTPTSSSNRPPPLWRPNCALSSNHCHVQLEALNQSRRTHKPFQLFIQKNSEHFLVRASHKTHRLTKQVIWRRDLGLWGIMGSTFHLYLCLFFIKSFPPPLILSVSLLHMMMAQKLTMLCVNTYNGLMAQTEIWLQ